MSESEGRMPRMPHSPQVEEMLVQRMREDLSSPPWWKTVWGRGAIVGGVVVAIGASLAAVTMLSPKEVSEAALVHCLEGPYRESDGRLSGSAMSVATPEGVLEIEDAEAACALMWSSGAMDEEDPLNPTPAPGDVPAEFTMCVTPEGEAAVVPGRIECSGLRLHPYGQGR